LSCICYSEKDEGAELIVGDEIQTLGRSVLSNIGPWSTESVYISSDKQNCTKTLSLVLYLIGMV